MKPTLIDTTSKAPIDGIDLVNETTGDLLGIIDAQTAFCGLKYGNRTIDTDLYELTMVAGYRVLGRNRQNACFDLFYRQNPDGGGFSIFAGLESVIKYINNLRLFPDDLEYLKGLGIFSDSAMESLSRGIQFTGDIWAVPEGTVVFPGEPLIRVTGPIDEAQILETTMLALVGHQTLIATKAARLRQATRGAPVVEFGTRRAHGVEAAAYGARAAYIGGCAGTSNVRAGKLFGIPVKGTHAHSWVESFDEEVEAFQGFAKVFPDNSVLLVDTYDTMDGISKAISVAQDLKNSGKTLQGIRIDSGDLAYYSKVAREMLNQAGFPDVKILASSDLDEWIIESLREQGARIDIWCVGTKLITSFQTPALGAVYKLMAADCSEGRLAPKIKISHNPMKVTNPGVKKIFRFFNTHGGMIGDLLAQYDEPMPHGRKVTAHHPMYDYMKKVYKPRYHVEELMIPVFLNGKQVYETPSLDECRNRAVAQTAQLEPEFKRFSNPHIYKISLSEKLYRIKKHLLKIHGKSLVL